MPSSPTKSYEIPSNSFKFHIYVNLSRHVTFIDHSPAASVDDEEPAPPFFRAVPKKCGAKVPQNWISELMKLMKLMKLSSRKRVPFDTGLATFRKKKGAHFSRKQKEITYGLDSWPSSLFRSGCFGVEGFLPTLFLIFSHFLL